MTRASLTRLACEALAVAAVFVLIGAAFAFPAAAVEAPATSEPAADGSGKTGGEQ